MATDVLQRFLTRRLFDVGGDDGRVAHLRSAVDDMVARLKAAPQRTAAMTMVAIDGEVGLNEPLVAEVMQVLEKRWQSYVGAFADDRLPTVARAILLQTLASAMGTDAIAAAVSLTARTMLPRIGEPADRELWSDIVLDADRRLANRAEREWAMPSAASLAEVELTLPAPGALTAPSMSRDWLSGRLEAAAGPTGADGQPLKTPANPNFSNVGQPWAPEFASIAATAISNAVNSVTKALAERIVEREQEDGFRSIIVEHVASAAQTLTRTAIGLERRTGLVWWKQALFSPAAGTGYRELDSSVSAALAALDASHQTGAFAPRMAEALVSEDAAVDRRRRDAGGAPSDGARVCDHRDDGSGPGCA